MQLINILKMKMIILGVSEYKILSEIPEFLENTIPSIEDIEKRLEKG